MSLLVTPIAITGAVTAGANLAALLLEAMDELDETILDGDVIVVTSKVVAKAEGRVVPFDGTDEAKLALIEA